MNARKGGTIEYAIHGTVFNCTEAVGVSRDRAYTLLRQGEKTKEGIGGLRSVRAWTLPFDVVKELSNSNRVGYDIIEVVAIYRPFVRRTHLSTETST